MNHKCPKSHTTNKQPLYEHPYHFVMLSLEDHVGAVMYPLTLNSKYSVLELPRKKSLMDEAANCTTRF